MTQDEKEFRVRNPDGMLNMWTIANGKDCLSTTQYILRDGTTSNDCQIFDTEAKAWAALDLYKQKQGLKKVPTIKTMREFDGGATRDTDTTKLDYEGFNNPLVDRCYAIYLNKHRQTANGLRDSDNWQNLFGDNHFDVCMKSLCRHVVDARLAHRGYKSEQSIVDSLNAVIFNAKAYLLKLLLEEEDANAAIFHNTEGE